jgi:hypothetical protein
MNDDPLLVQLRQLAERLQERNVPLIVGGGYGLLLKANYIQSVGVRTRLEQIPIARSTGDIDVFLTTEVITDRDKTTVIREALSELGFSPVPGAENYQFFREVVVGGAARNLKFDFLAAPVSGEDAKRVKMDKRRISPRGGKGLHAHTTPEALTVEEHLLALDVGEGDQRVEVFIPHPFSYVLLKLFALRDQITNEGKEFGRHHAFDIYTTWAMMTEDEFEQAERLRNRYAGVGVMLEAFEVARTLFRGESAPGMIRLREHAQGADVGLVETDEFIKDIGGLFLRTENQGS